MNALPRMVYMARYIKNIYVACLLCFLGFSNSVCLGQEWSQWLGNQRDGVWREKDILEKFPPGGPKVLWRLPIGGGYSGPAVQGGRVFLTDRVLETGAKDPQNLFQRANSKGNERVFCFDAETGKTIWQHSYPCQYSISYPCGPRATPTV